ncbi:Complement receptor type 2, partial [Stegodyphus mimosarum]
NCIGTCDAGHIFIDGASEHIHSCVYSEGIWKPSSTFPLCEPFCDPPCENGGSCITHNTCSCTNEYRGEVCQYPISLCVLSKNRQPSNWQCNHTAIDTACDISCHAPDTSEASTEIYRHVCSIEGLWSPPLPSCVQVLECRELHPITNGRWLLVIGQNFISGSKAIYSCDDGYYLRSESQLICQSNGTWSKDPPQCVQE